MAGTRNWREIRGERALSEERVRAFSRLMAAQEQIAAALTPTGVSSERLDAALAAAEEALPRGERDLRDFYRPALELYVRALGGRLEQRRSTGGEERLDLAAIFPEVTVRIDDTDQA